MCGIIGYAGKEKNAIHVLINGLKNLEYRGYDSAGIAIRENNHVEIVKSEGKIVNLEKKIKGLDDSTIGIGHTRWATHGGATTINSHPHRVGTVTLVHNGIIENYEKIKKDLIKEGYEFKSSTDTEVACALIDKLYKKTNDKLEALKEANHIINGSFAFAIMFDDDVNNLYAMRKDSPLIIGIGEGCNFLASDVPAILEFTNKYILLDKDEYAVVNNDKVVIYDENENMLTKEVLTYDGDKEVAMKAGYEHFMIKEINDEPIVFDNMFKQFDADNIDDLKKSMPDFSKYKKIDIIGCGSAYHAGLLGKSLIEEYADLLVNVEIASEYRYKKTFSDNDTLTILISQSGETADTLAALRKAKEKGIDTLGIVNTVSSSIAREADDVLYIKAGAEISVATTKAYSAQVLMLLLIALVIGYENKKISKEEANNVISEIKKLPKYIKEVISKKSECDDVAKSIYEKNNIFFIGRKVDYALCMEGSLKLKEVSYIHSESYAAGELKHGTISLIEEGTPVISIVTDEGIEEKTISNIKEVKARNAYVVLITTDKIYEKYKTSDFYDKKIVLENKNNYINPLLVATILQLLAYQVAYLRGEAIDQPRNLAKSVTVE
ncbi:MAG: glutamine--fructose-6-phosphate transaminase (isomerizing) [Bacilli bacterium]